MARPPDVASLAGAARLRYSSSSRSASEVLNSGRVAVEAIDIPDIHAYYLGPRDSGHSSSAAGRWSAPLRCALSQIGREPTSTRSSNGSHKVSGPAPCSCPHRFSAAIRKSGVLLMSRARTVAADHSTRASRRRHSPRHPTPRRFAIPVSQNGGGSTRASSPYRPSSRHNSIGSSSRSWTISFGIDTVGRGAKIDVHVLEKSGYSLLQHHVCVFPRALGDPVGLPFVEGWKPLTR